MYMNNYDVSDTEQLYYYVNILYIMFDSYSINPSRFPNVYTFQTVKHFISSKYTIGFKKHSINICSQIRPSESVL